MQVAGHERVWAIADEDLERENEEKTSAVHFLRFELSRQMRARVKAGAASASASTTSSYRHAVERSARRSTHVADRRLEISSVRTENPAA